MDESLASPRPNLTPQQIEHLDGYNQLLKQEDLPPLLRPHVERLAADLQSQPASEVTTEEALVGFAEQRETSNAHNADMLHQRLEISPRHHQEHLEKASFVPDLKDRPTEEQDMIGEVVEIGQEAAEGDVSSQEGASINRGIASLGEDLSGAPESKLEDMRSLESVQNKELLFRFKMTDETAVDFTEPEHYAPRIAPSAEAYPVPTYLKDILRDSLKGMDTYDRTITQEGWDKQLVEIVTGYLRDSDSGRQLQHDLKITDLKALTPEQAVKLSLGVVQDLSRYSQRKEEVDDKRADGLTTMQLLQEGIEHGTDPDWEGNGVCRNIACNVKAVFESLKMSQGELSMLRNTYAVYDAGVKGKGYDDKREDLSHSFSPLAVGGGHAWVKFITIDRQGSANITIADPTWALGEDSITALQRMDYTMPRMAGMARQLLELSDHKKDVFLELSRYYDRLDLQSMRDSKGQWDYANQRQTRGFLMTEYLKAARVALPEFPNNEGVVVPSFVSGTAYRLQDKLERGELETLFHISQHHGIDNFKTILGAYIRGQTGHLAPLQHPERLIQPDDDLQSTIFDVLGKEKAIECADKDGKFRARLRELRPDALPAFDALTIAADARELNFMASTHNANILYSDDSKSVMHKVRQELRRRAGDDALFDAVTFGRSDYDLVKNYAGLRERIDKIAKRQG